MRHAALALLLVACGSSRAQPSSTDAAPAAPPVMAIDAAPVVRPVRVISTTGTVERHAGDGWMPLATGETLSVDDSIRTGDTGGAELELADGMVVSLAERSEITVLDLSRSISEVLLAEGRVTAVSPVGVRIRIQTRDRTVAESDGGRFSVLDRGGAVAVAVHEGTAAVRARGGEVLVPADHQTLVLSGAKPGAPHPIPTSLFLKVRQKAGARVSGETSPGAVVSVDGVVLVSDADGRFGGEVPRGDGVIVVQVEDALGRRHRRVLKRVVERRRPRLETSVEWK